MLTYGDFRLWMVNNLHSLLERVINAKRNRVSPYYILVVVKKGYFGPPAKTNNELIATDIEKEQAKKANQKLIEKNFEGKTVISNRIIVMDKAPPIPMVGSSLWWVNNQTGQVKCIYILPPDKPVMGEQEFTEDSKLVFESAKKSKVPLIYNN